MLFRRKPPRKFLDWLETEDTDQIEEIQGGQTYGIEQSEEGNIIANRAHMLLKEGKVANVHIVTGTEFVAHDEFHDTLNFGHKISGKTNINRLSIYGTKNNIHIVSGLNVRHIELQCTPHQPTAEPTLLKNCWIDTLHIPHVARGQAILQIENCSIGRIDLDNKCLSSLRIFGGCILSLSCPPPYEENPFLGEVSIDSYTVFPRKDGLYKGRHAGPQPWSNITSHLMKMNNVEAASRFHSVELKIIRKSIPPVAKAFSYLYDVLSDYGNSLVRPLVWIVLLSLLSFILFLGTSGAALTSEADTSNWRSILSSEWGRALWISIDPIINPLGITKRSSYVEPETLYLLMYHAIHRVLVVVLLFLLILGLRRKFRLGA